jgi:hypothetical protein
MGKSVAELEQEIKQLQRQITGKDAGLFALINQVKDELIVARWLEFSELPVGTRVRGGSTHLTPAKGVYLGLDNGEDSGNWMRYQPLDTDEIRYINRYHLEFAIGNQWYNVKGEKVNA